MACLDVVAAAYTICHILSALIMASDLLKHKADCGTSQLKSIQPLPFTTKDKFLTPGRGTEEHGGCRSCFHGQGLVPESFPAPLLTWSAKSCSSGYLKKIMLCTWSRASSPRKGEGPSPLLLCHNLLGYFLASSRGAFHQTIWGTIYFSVCLWKWPSGGEQTHFIYIYIWT